jgi:hypothetical protein
MLMWPAVRGAGAGAIATIPMSLVMAAARRLGMLGEPPPRKVVGRLLASAGVRPRRPRPNGLAWLGHLAFGACAGALFGPAATRLQTRSGRVAAGALYGAAVWTAMYGYVLPALGFMRKPSRDRQGRPTSMAIAHLVYGAGLGAMLHGGARSPEGPDAAWRRRLQFHFQTKRRRSVR